MIKESCLLRIIQKFLSPVHENVLSCRTGNSGTVSVSYCFFTFKKGRKDGNVWVLKIQFLFFLSENSFDFWSERLCYYGVQRLCYFKIPKPSIQDKPPLQFFLITEKYVEISFTGQIKQLSTWEAIQNTKLWLPTGFLVKRKACEFFEGG